MHGPPKMVDVMADMIQKGASAGNTGRAHSKGQVSNTITHLKTYMSLGLQFESVDGVSIVDNTNYIDYEYCRAYFAQAN